MNTTDLLKKYPNLIEKCREWDCGFEEAIKRLDKVDIPKSRESALKQTKLSQN